MAISSFIPKVWSARLQENFHKALVFGSLCSRNYEGEISQWGDTVHISNRIKATDAEEKARIEGYFQKWYDKRGNN